MIYICTWNVRGLNDPLKIKEVKPFIDSNKFTMFALTDTRVKLTNKDKCKGSLVGFGLGVIPIIIIPKAKSDLLGNKLWFMLRLFLLHISLFRV